MFSSLVARFSLGVKAAEDRRKAKADAAIVGADPVVNAVPVVHADPGDQEADLVLDLDDDEDDVPAPLETLSIELADQTVDNLVRDLARTRVQAEPEAEIAEPTGDIYAIEPSVPPAGLDRETPFFRDISLDMFVLTGWLKVTPENAAKIASVVDDWSTRVKDLAAGAAFEDELEAELVGGKVPRRTKRNTQHTERITKDAIIVMRGVDYTTRGKIQRSNFRNSFLARKVGPGFTDRGKYGPTPLKGPTVKYFRNGRLQAAGWKTVEAFETFVDTLSTALGLPGIDVTKHRLSLVTGSARIKTVPTGGIAMARLSESLRGRGESVEWKPSSGNNGMKLIVPDGEGDRTASVFSNGYVKMFALNEAQLARMVGTVTEALRPVLAA